MINIDFSSIRSQQKRGGKRDPFPSRHGSNSGQNSPYSLAARSRSLTPQRNPHSSPDITDFPCDRPDRPTGASFGTLIENTSSPKLRRERHSRSSSLSACSETNYKEITKDVEDNFRRQKKAFATSPDGDVEIQVPSRSQTPRKSQFIRGRRTRLGGPLSKCPLKPDGLEAGYVSDESRSTTPSGARMCAPSSHIDQVNNTRELTTGGHTMPTGAPIVPNLQAGQMMCQSLPMNFDGVAGMQPGNMCGMQPGSMTGMQYGSMTGMQYGSMVGMQPGNMTGMQYGSMTGMQPGNMVGMQHGSMAGMQQGSMTGMQPGGMAGMHKGSMSGMQPGSMAGMQQGSMSGMQPGSMAGMPQGSMSGMQPGSMAGMQQGSMSGMQPGNMTGMQQVSMSGMQPGSMAGMQQGSMSCMQPGSMAGVQQPVMMQPMMMGQINQQPMMVVQMPQIPDGARPANVAYPGNNLQGVPCNQVVFMPVETGDDPIKNDVPHAFPLSPNRVYPRGTQYPDQPREEERDGGSLPARGDEDGGKRYDDRRYDASPPRPGTHGSPPRSGERRPGDSTPRGIPPPSGIPPRTVQLDNKRSYDKSMSSHDLREVASQPQEKPFVASLRPQTSHDLRLPSPNAPDAGTRAFSPLPRLSEEQRAARGGWTRNGPPIPRASDDDRYRSGGPPSMSPASDDDPYRNGPLKLSPTRDDRYRGGSSMPPPKERRDQSAGTGGAHQPQYQDENPRQHYPQSFIAGQVPSTRTQDDSSNKHENDKPRYKGPSLDSVDHARLTTSTRPASPPHGSTRAAPSARDMGNPPHVPMDNYARPHREMGNPPNSLMGSYDRLSPSAGSAQPSPPGTSMDNYARLSPSAHNNPPSQAVTPAGTHTSYRPPPYGANGSSAPETRGHLRGQSSLDSSYPRAMSPSSGRLTSDKSQGVAPSYPYNSARPDVPPPAWPELSSPGHHSTSWDRSIDYSKCDHVSPLPNNDVLSQQYPPYGCPPSSSAPSPRSPPKQHSYSISDRDVGGGPPSASRPPTPASPRQPSYSYSMHVRDIYTPSPPPPPSQTQPALDAIYARSPPPPTHPPSSSRPLTPPSRRIPPPDTANHSSSYPQPNPAPKASPPPPNATGMRAPSYSSYTQPHLTSSHLNQIAAVPRPLASTRDVCRGGEQPPVDLIVEVTTTKFNANVAFQHAQVTLDRCTATIQISVKFEGKLVGNGSTQVDFAEPRPFSTEVFTKVSMMTKEKIMLTLARAVDVDRVVMHCRGKASSTTVCSNDSVHYADEFGVLRQKRREAVFNYDMTIQAKGEVQPHKKRDAVWLLFDFLIEGDLRCGM